MNLNEWEEVFLLHQRPFGDTSLILEVFSKINGKISVLAKGSKKPKSKFFGYITPFKKLYITYSGKSELKTLTNIERSFEQSSPLTSKKNYSLLYINEILIKLLPKNAASKEIFYLYEKFIDDIHLTENLNDLLRGFELELLELIGFGLDLKNDFSGEVIKEELEYNFIPDKGFIMKTKGKFSGVDILNIKRKNFSAIEPDKVKSITQGLLNFCLDGDELVSKKIFRKLKV
jgi:DNA repair protein RecO (recombination protein O)